MWVQRTPEEIAKWREKRVKQARTDGLLIGLVGWVLGSLVLSAGWVVSLSSGFAVQRNWGGTFWSRLPICSLVCLPMVFLARRIETRRALRVAELRTICPKCDTAAESNAGAACQCGGTFVLSSTMKWVE